MLAGQDPASVRFHTVVDLTWAILMEVYQGYGMKFDEAMNELKDRIMDPATREGQKARVPTPAEEAASMAMLQSMIGGSDFGGPKG